MQIEEAIYQKAVEFGASEFADNFRRQGEFLRKLQAGDIKLLFIPTDDAWTAVMETLSDDTYTFTILNHVSETFDKISPTVEMLSGLVLPLSREHLTTLGVRGVAIIGGVRIIFINKLIINDEQAPQQLSTLQLLRELFQFDRQLMRTRPTKHYRIDAAKWARWQSLATPELKSEVQYLQYSFDEWLDSLAFGIDQFVDQYKAANCDVYVSTGYSDKEKQSASELWMFDIFSKVLASLNYQLEPTNNKYWTVLRHPANQNKCAQILVVDDFVRTGTHMTQRLIHTPGLFKLMNQRNATLLILTPIMINVDQFERTFADVSSDEAPRAEYDTLQRLIKTQTKYLTKIFYDKATYGYIILDHNGSDKYETEIAGGNLGDGRALGPLLEGDSVDNPYRYPPALYHLVYGDGNLPLKQYGFIAVGDGLYQIKF